MAVSHAWLHCRSDNTYGHIIEGNLCVSEFGWIAVALNAKPLVPVSLEVVAAPSNSVAGLLVEAAATDARSD